MLRLANVFQPALQRSIFLSSLASLMNSVGNNVQQFVIAFPQFSLSLAANPLQRAANETHIAHSFCTVPPQLFFPERGGRKEFS